MLYLRVIMLKKLEGMAPAPYPIKNRVNMYQAKVLELKPKDLSVAITIAYTTHLPRETCNLLKQMLNR